MRVLGIESSCDDTGVAVVEDGRYLLGAAVLSSSAVHQTFGGVVPELASREHVMAVIPAMEAALGAASLTIDQCDAIAVTQGPGLLGSLLVGVTAAKALALALRRPLVGVHHLEAHLYANALVAPIEYPALAVLVSGGHTAMYRWYDHGGLQLIGETVDDAAGEVLDKGARLLGLGYPGGPQVERMANAIGATDLRLPIPRLKNPERRFDFSFSGLKTALADMVGRHPERRAELALALQTAVVESLVEHALQACETYELERIYLAGGVSANQALRSTMTERAMSHGITVLAPRPQDSTDNGAMVAAAGYYHARLGHLMALNEGPRTPYPLGESGD